MATCSKCGTDYTNRGGPSLECDCGRKIELEEIARQDQSSGVMVDSLEAAAKRILRGDVQGLCGMAFGIGAALHRTREMAAKRNHAEAMKAIDELYNLVRDALASGWRQ